MTKLYYGHGLTEASHHFQTEPEAGKERLTDTTSFSLSFFFPQQPVETNATGKTASPSPAPSEEPRPS